MAYVGNRGVHLFMYNQNSELAARFDLALGSALKQSVANPFFGIIKSGPLASATVAAVAIAAALPAVHGAARDVQGGVVNPFAYIGRIPSIMR